MGDARDLELTLRSHLPLVAVESHEERRVLDLFRRLAVPIRQPLFTWSATEGLLREDIVMDTGPNQDLVEPEALLKHIKDYARAGVFLLLDFHPWLDDPILVRHIKEIALSHPKTETRIAFLSHTLDIPEELTNHTARFQLAMPDRDTLLKLIKKVAADWSQTNPGRRVSSNKATIDRLLHTLGGLTLTDAHRLLHNIVFDDGAITGDDLDEIAKAKYELLNQDGILHFEYETARFGEVGGFEPLKRWLAHRKGVFLGTETGQDLDPPKGMMLVGVQGGGKSLAAKAVAGAWGLPLLRLDFGTLYNKFHGETERNMRSALKTAAAMAPCVLWIDEIEKGIATGSNDGGTSQRVLGTLLTWMSEREENVFIVATANDISALPPELIRKGRLDEIFFVDLPDHETRQAIFKIHLKRRGLDPEQFPLSELAETSDGFSGAEIEQAVVAMRYTARAQRRKANAEDLLEEIHRTKPLSVVMSEPLAKLREWSKGRTVLAN